MHRPPAATIVTRISWILAGLLSAGCQSQAGSAEAVPGADSRSGADITLPAAQSSPDKATGSVTFIGNATVLIRYAGMTILTDPTFIHKHEQVSLGYGMHTTRLTDPAMDIRDLPPLDLILLSHFHGDHFDQVAEEKLQKDLPIITTEHASTELSDKGFTQTIPLATWESTVVKKGEFQVQITSMPGKHGPGMVEAFLPTVMGSMLEFQTIQGQVTLRLYITGDTLIHDDLKEIPNRYPNIDLALFHLGGTRIMGILLTMDAEQGVEAIHLINPREVIPIHYNDYEVFKSPLEEFKNAVAVAGLENRVRYLSHGETYEFETTAGGSTM